MLTSRVAINSNITHPFQWIVGCTPMGNPYISQKKTWVYMGKLSPKILRLNTINTVRVHVRLGYIQLALDPLSLPPFINTDTPTPNLSGARYQGTFHLASGSFSPGLKTSGRGFQETQLKKKHSGSRRFLGSEINGSFCWGC